MGGDSKTNKHGVFHGKRVSGDRQLISGIVIRIKRKSITYPLQFKNVVITILITPAAISGFPAPVSRHCMAISPSERIRAATFVEWAPSESRTIKPALVQVPSPDR